MPLTTRERFLRIMRYEPVDRLPIMSAETYYEEPALAGWRAEGLEGHPDAVLGIENMYGVPIDFGARPAFERRVLAEDDEYITETDYYGTTVRRRKDAPSMYYGHIDFPVKTLADWRTYAERYQPTPDRFDRESAATLHDADRPVGLALFPFFFRMGFYVLGMERFLTAVYDEPALIHAMFEHWGDFMLRLIEPALATTRVDFATFAEDLAYKGGPHFSPAIYREFWLPYQQPIIDLLRRHHVPVIAHWSSGNFEAILPLMMESGINCVMPAEVNAGMDPVVLRKKYGRDLLIYGGVPKEALIAGPAAIDAELARLRPLMVEGGFLPALDDVVPPEVAVDDLQILYRAVAGDPVVDR